MDGSELAEVVIPYAKEPARRLDQDLILLNVYCLDERESVLMQRDYVERVAEIVKSHSEKVQRSAGIELGSRAVHARGKLVQGHPAGGILRYSGGNDIALILRATHERSGVSQRDCGSVAHKVLHGVTSPIFLVRPH